MSDRRIHVFHAVAKHLSFTKAAEVLFMTQPAVTFQIRQLGSSSPGAKSCMASWWTLSKNRTLKHLRCWPITRPWPG